MRLDPQVKDELDPFMVTNKDKKVVKGKAIENLKKESTSDKEGFVTAGDMAALQKVKDVLYGPVNIGKLEREMFSSKIAGITGYPDFNLNKARVKV